MVSTRRAALQGAMAGAAGLLVGGCGGGKAPASTGSAAQLKTSVSLLADFHQAEAATLAAYEAAAPRLPKDAGRGEMLALARQERLQLARLERAIRSLGATVPVAAAAASGAGASDQGSRTLLEGCVERERAAIARYVRRMGELMPQTLRSPLAPNLAQAGAHLVVLGRLLERPVVALATLEGVG